MAEIAEENAAGAAIEARDVDDADIRDTDIEFSCPHCSNSMVIDYRGAGLQVACSQCGETVLVPIPEGMELNDLDLDPGEILKQLFATRRNFLFHTDVVFSDTAVRLLVVVLLHKILPVPVGFFQGHLALRLALLLVGIDQTVIDLDFPFALASVRLRP